MREKDFPLIEFRAIVSQGGVAINPGPCLFPITVRIHGHEIEGIDPQGREVVDDADDAFPFTIFPGGVSSILVLYMCGVGSFGRGIVKLLIL